jgi:hypothetical protein
VVKISDWVSPGNASNVGCPAAGAAGNERDDAAAFLNCDLGF